MCERDFLQTHFHSITTVASNGSYIADLTITKSNATTTLRLEGTWQVKDGRLFDAVTNGTDTEMRRPYPYTTDQQITRLDEAALELEGQPGYAFRRITK